MHEFAEMTMKTFSERIKVCVSVIVGRQSVSEKPRATFFAKHSIFGKHSNNFHLIKK